MFIKNRLISAIFIALVSATTAYSQSWGSGSWLPRLNLSNSGGNTRQVQLLTFNRNMSNISESMASQAMEGFFTGVTAQGYYSITLSDEYVREARGSKTVDTLSDLAIAGSIFVLLPFENRLPRGRYTYRLTVKLDIRDLDGGLVREVIKSDEYTVIGRKNERDDREIQLMSGIYSQLIGRARDELNYNASRINNRLRDVAQSRSFHINFHEFSDKIRNGSVVAIFPIDGSDVAESQRVLGELTRHFMNSGRSFTVVNREHIERGLQEIILQGSRRVDQDTAVTVGKWLGARIIVVGRIDTISNGKQLILTAIDVETMQTIVVSTTRFVDDSRYR